MLTKLTNLMTLRAGLVCASVVAAGVVMASPASADASSSAIVNTNGTYAGEAWFNRAAGGKPAFFDVKDGKCDSQPVYVTYRIKDGGWRKYTNYNGCYKTTRVELESGTFNIRYRVCVDTFMPICSAPKDDNNG